MATASMSPSTNNHPAKFPPSEGPRIRGNFEVNENVSKGTKPTTFDVDFVLKTGHFSTAGDRSRNRVCKCVRARTLGSICEARLSFAQRRNNYLFPEGSCLLRCVACMFLTNPQVHQARVERSDDRSRLRVSQSSSWSGQCPGT